jgi:hypothetical protein
MTEDMGRRRAGVASAGVAVAVLLVLVGVLPEPITLGALLVAVLAGWRYVPRFWTVVVRGAIGGVAAGLLVLGPGMRVAMRIVAVMDPLRTPELSLEGTLLIIVMLGGMFGGIVGIAVTVLRAGFDLSPRTAATVSTAVVVAMFVGEPELRAELLELGAGGWFNIPMFAVVAAAYGVAAARLVDRLGARTRRRLASGTAAVRA